MDIEALIKARKHLRLVHHIPGRIRIKFDTAVMQHPRLKEILDKGHALPGIKNVRINMKGRSVIIEYDRRRIQPQLWETLFNTREPGRFVKIVSEFEKQIKR